MSVINMQMQFANLDGNLTEVASQLRAIANEIEQAAGLQPSMLGANLRDRDGYSVGSWLVKRLGL
jgi:hypothetical protein